ncbi:hypothetical protein, partial [Burkholderia sp.]|uniref:hypothetical protein n=1 Tax=Burkholderia sp. TaxID=36773 RepID=UPI0025BC3E9F
MKIFRAEMRETPGIMIHAPQRSSGNARVRCRCRLPARRKECTCDRGSLRNAQGPARSGDPHAEARPIRFIAETSPPRPARGRLRVNGGRTRAASAEYAGDGSCDIAGGRARHPLRRQG